MRAKEQVWSNESSSVSRVTFRFTVNDLSGRFRMLKNKNCSFFSIIVQTVCIYTHTHSLYSLYGLPQWFCSKESTCNVGDTGGPGSVPGWEDPLEKEIPWSNPLKYSYLRNPMHRGAWQVTVHGVTKSWKRLSTHAYTLYMHCIHNIYMLTISEVKSLSHV